MIVVDASVIANAIADDSRAGASARERLADADRVIAPDLVDVASVSVFRRRWLHGSLTQQRFADAVADLLAMPIERFPTGPLMRAAFELRANITAYDACYVALANAMDCVLVTGDVRLAQAPTITCATEVLR